jgi:DNA-binding NarL/FixJ family response regulator
MANLKQIFLVDDDEFYLQMLSDSLSKNPGYSIHTFTSGEKCFEKLYEVRPDVIVLDYFLSDNDPKAETGLNVLEKIKKSYPSVKVIMLSGQGKYGIAASTIAKGATQYVVKDNDSFKKIDEIISSL